MDECIYDPSIRFTWDELKRLRNLRVHGFDFVHVQEVFAEWTLTIEDDRFHYYERRFMTLGWWSGTPVAVVHTDTEESIHVISFRKATRRETNQLLENLPD
jgi:uncharacterized DUF497 family protein